MILVKISEFNLRWCRGCCDDCFRWGGGVLDNTIIGSSAFFEQAEKGKRGQIYLKQFIVVRGA